MQIRMDILIKMREDIFATSFPIWCHSDFNNAIGVKGKKTKMLFEFVNSILNNRIPTKCHIIFPKTEIS